MSGSKVYEKLVTIGNEILDLDNMVDEVFESIKEIRQQILSAEVTDQEAQKVLLLLNEQEEKNNGIRQSVNHVHDALVNLRRSKEFNAEEFEDINMYMRETECIEHSAAYLADRIDFLMNTTVGFININQNKSIKKFTMWTFGLAIPALIFAFFSMNLPFPWVR